MPSATSVIRALCGIDRRAPCSDAERRAALWLRDELERRGHDAWIETVWVRPQWSLLLALHAVLAAAASVASVSLPAVGLGVVLAVAAFVALEAGGRRTPLRIPFRRRATQLVVTEPEDPEAVRLVLCAGYDAPRRGLVYRDGLRRLAARGRRVPLGPAGWTVLACLVVAASAGLRLAGIDGLWIGILQFIPTMGLLLVFAAAVDVALSEYAPGASEPASGAALALGLLDELVARPPDELSACVVLSGASEAFPPPALRAHLRAERFDPAEVAVLELGPCGAGRPVVTARHRQLRAAALAAGLPLVPLRRATLARAATTLRLPAARLWCAEAGIAPGTRQPGDLPEAVDPDALRAAHDAALDLVDALDENLAERLAARAQAPAAAA